MYRDISQFNHNDCPSTATKLLLQDKSTPALVDYLNDYISDIYPYFSMSEINNYLKRYPEFQTKSWKEYRKHQYKEA